jgi:citrate lyase subunit beta/citryl-CoA lyase
MTVTYLFVPAHEPKKIERAMTAGSDAVVFDLEDSVPEPQKAAARAALSTRPNAPAGLELWVRVNHESPLFEADVERIDWRSVSGAVLPKAEDARKVAALEAAGADRIILLLESAAGLRGLRHLAQASRRVERCALGSWDLSLDLGLLAVDEPDEAELIWHLRAILAFESRCLGLRPPIDGIYSRLNDDAGLRHTCERVHRLGFAGKLLVHPRQIAVVQAVFRPDQERLQLAREVVDAYEDAVRNGRGAIQVRGRMVDRPIAQRAKALLEYASGGREREFAVDDMLASKTSEP